METPEMVRIAAVQKEATDVTTIFFRKRMDAKPGQFVMAWIPSMDEKPFAVSHLGEDTMGITVAAVGPFSKRLTGMRPGERVGIRGPYGTGYTLEGTRIVMIGGGYGVASLALLAERALSSGKDVTFINGARTKDRLVFTDRIARMGAKQKIATDDGSAGTKGRTTDILEAMLTETIDKVFACGPEMMLKKVADICATRGIKGDVSVERYFKCGYGLCGHCCMDPLGIRACVEGPVVSVDAARQLTEFGKYHRAKSGKKEQFHA